MWIDGSSDCNNLLKVVKRGDALFREVQSFITSTNCFACEPDLKKKKT